MTHRSLRERLLVELENGPGTCVELTQRLSARGQSALPTNVHRALRRMVDDGVALESVADFVQHMKRTHAELGGTVTYELAAESNECGLGYMQGRGAA
jgi:hypothetical protein